MTDFNQFHESFNPDPQLPAKKVPDMLNVLTILTFIGSGLGLLGAIYTYFTVCKSMEMMAKLSQSDNPMAGMMNAMSDVMARQCEMKLPVMIITLVSVALCFFGAMQMRKLKRSGFFLYLLGQIAAPLALVLMGAAGGSFVAVAGYVFPLIFIILYATQLKHLK
ncbi:hypothetical protein [Taibaiella koreensis]|uniref:hypothetical protein n=1 Tax=Taibaiella koreensis TaxID=1268548 RepID=UPI000E59DECC|nr:hypothetical protein [Taibaiella koreensis]